jgi:hypothetical protein
VPLSSWLRQHRPPQTKTVWLTRAERCPGSHEHRRLAHTAHRRGPGSWHQQRRVTGFVEFRPDPCTDSQRRVHTAQRAVLWCVRHVGTHDATHGTAHSVVVCPPCRHARRHTRCGRCVICPSCLAIGRAVLRQVTDLAASIAARLASTWSLRNAPDHERRFAHRAAQGGTGWHRVRCGQSAEGCVNQLLRHGCVAGANVLGCDPRPLGRGSSVL